MGWVVRRSEGKAVRVSWPDLLGGTAHPIHAAPARSVNPQRSAFIGVHRRPIITFVRGICGWVEFRWHDKCLIGMEFPNAEPPLLCSIFHSSFECGPDGRAPSILRGCHGHVTLLPSIPGRALDQNHHQPRPTKTNLNQNQNHLKPTKTITTGRIAAAGDGSVGTGFGAESHLRENVPLPCCLPRRPADCGSYQFTHEFRQGPNNKGS